MTNLQLLLSIGIPTFAIILATVLQTNSNNACFSAIEQRLVVIGGDQRRFYEILGRHDGEISVLKERLK